jgi:hypothetical protein
MALNYLYFNLSKTIRNGRQEKVPHSFMRRRYEPGHGVEELPGTE